MAIVVLLQSQQRAEEFLKRVIKLKLDSVRGQGVTPTVNLLRDNAMPVMMLMAFVQIEGEAFLRATFTAPLKAILEDPAALEVNPAKESSPEAIAHSVKQLQLCCDSIMAALQSHRDLIPLSFRRLCLFIRTSVEHALGPEALTGMNDETALPPALKVLSAFMFLRFIVPAVMAPEKYALFPPGSVPTHKTGSLLLIGKVLTSLANGAFHREEYMLPFNDFIRTSLPNMKNFLVFISQVPAKDDGRRNRSLDPSYMELAVNHLYAFLQTVMPRIEEKPVPEYVLDRMDRLRTAVAPQKKDSLRFKGFKALTISTGNKKKLIAAATITSATMSRNIKKSGSTGDLSETAMQEDDVAGEEDGDALRSVSVDVNDAPSSASMPQLSQEQRAEMLSRAKKAGDSPILDPSIAAIARTNSRRGSILPERSVFGNNAPVRRGSSSDSDFKGDMLKYLQAGCKSVDGMEVASDSVELLAAWLGVIWEALVRDAIKTYQRRTIAMQAPPPPTLASGAAPAAPAPPPPSATPLLKEHVIHISDVEAAAKILVPVTLAYFSEKHDLKHKSLGITAADLVKDAQELARKSMDIESVLMAVCGGHKLPLTFDGPSSTRLAQLVAFVGFDALQLCVLPAKQAGAQHITAQDVVAAVQSNHSLSQLVGNCGIREKKIPFNNSLPAPLKPASSSPVAEMNPPSPPGEKPSAPRVVGPPPMSAASRPMRSTPSRLAESTVPEEDEEEDESDDDD
eukprot:Unigene3802_Nuclearia_a/m.11587 Unigene3802_Nuclearia_a/g.11587  ORF Unigene3802_Nuclearia_a/g.11587 Unigene3802_Nuclearia_a/m.11587 type:complete len:738 (+) Unigene3802_Nuclearia_a:2-2215(+)